MPATGSIQLTFQSAPVPKDERYSNFAGIRPDHGLEFQSAPVPKDERYTPWPHGVAEAAKGFQSAPVPKDERYLDAGYVNPCWSRNVGVSIRSRP